MRECKCLNGTDNGFSNEYNYLEIYILLLLEIHRAKIISSVRGLIRQTGSAKLDPPFLPKCPS